MPCRQVSDLSPSELLEWRFERLMSYGPAKLLSIDRSLPGFARS